MFTRRNYAINVIRKWIFISCLVFYFFHSTTIFAAISVSGLTSQEVYADSVSFTINSEAGYSYSASINDTPVDIDSQITISEPEYYELTILRTELATNIEDSLLIQFIVRSSERLDTEWGLPKFTPLPMIDSASDEFTGSEIKIVTPATFPAGLEIPVIAWVSNSTTGERTGVNGTITSAEYASFPIPLLRGVGSVFLPGAIGNQTIHYNGTVKTESVNKDIHIEPSTSWQEVSGSIASDTIWSANSRVKITDTLTIEPDITLTIGPGSVIIVAPEVSINVEGHIVTNGSDIAPIVFTAENRNEPWGGFMFESSSCSGNMNGTIFTASGADQDWFNTYKSGDFTHKKQQCLFYLSNGSNLYLTKCYMVDNYGQLGHGQSSYLSMTDCLVQKFITCGQYNAGGVSFDNCALIEFPGDREKFADADNDVIYLNGGPHTFTDCLMGWTLDDGIDAGEGETGEVIINNCWFESCIHEATAWSCGSGQYRYATMNNTVVTNCGQAIECGYNSPFITARNVFCTANVVGARFGDNYERAYSGGLSVADSLLLFNHRDIWSRCWNDWQEHVSRTDIENNYISKVDNSYPNNTLWAPANNPAQLDKLRSFMSTAAGNVGVGIAVNNSVLPLLEDKTEYNIPVRLSTFTDSNVSVDYTVNSNNDIITSSTLLYIPGESVKYVSFSVGDTSSIRNIRISLSNPVNAELANYQLIYEKPYELSENLVSEGDILEYFKGSTAPPSNWNETDLTDSWLTGPAPIGYDTDSNNGNQACIATYLDDMKGSYYSVYTRCPFWLDDPERVKTLTLTVRWDDGYIAYINGVEVSSHYPPSTVAYNQPAGTNNHETHCYTIPDEIDLTPYTGLLEPGLNVLAIQVHNTTKDSSDMFLSPELYCTIIPIAGDSEPDGDIDVADLSAITGTWLSMDGDSRYDKIFDISKDKDGIINMLDIEIFAQNWLAGIEIIPE